MWQNSIISEDGIPLKCKCTNSPEPCFEDNSNFVPPLEPCQGTPSQRASVEDEDDEDDNHKGYIKLFPEATGKALRPEKTAFEFLQQKQQLEGKVSWEPFVSQEEWGLAVWLMKNVGQKSTDEYLQLLIVS